MTSNAGSELISSLCADPETAPNAEGLADALYEALSKIFKPAFLGRITLIPYLPLTDNELKSIIQLQLQRVQKRFYSQYHAQLTFHHDVTADILNRCQIDSIGARQIDNTINKRLLPKLSEYCLTQMLSGKTLKTVEIMLDQQCQYSISTSITKSKKSLKNVKPKKIRESLCKSTV